MGLVPQQLHPLQVSDLEYVGPYYITFQQKTVLVKCEDVKTDLGLLKSIYFGMPAFFKEIKVKS